MILGYKGKFLLVPVLFFLFPWYGFSGDYTLGYGLVFSGNELPADKIGDDFSRIAAGGHSSYFYIEKKVADSFTLSMSPGAMNFEDNEAQFHVQYNILSANYKMDTKLFPVVGTGLGACIATLTEGPGGLGEVQAGHFMRNSTFLWMARAGLGYRFANRVELILEGRAIGFLDGEFGKLNSYNAGFAVGYSPE